MASTEPPAPRDLSWRELAVPAFGPSLLASVGWGAVIPIVPLSARHLGATVAGAALVVGLGSLVELFASLPAGALVARVGERRALMGAGLIEAAGATIGLTARSLPTLVLAVMLMGMTQTVFLLARQAYLTAIVPLHMRARAMSTMGGSMRVGLLVGPLLGALTITRWGPQGSYVVGIAGSLAAFAVVAFGPDITAAHEAAEADVRRSVLSVLVDHRRVLLTVGLGVTAISATRAARVVIGPLWCQHVGMTAAVTSLVFGIASAFELLTVYPGGSAMDRWGRVWVAVPCVVVMGAGFVLLPLTHRFATVAAVSAVIGVGNGIGSGIVMTLGADAAPAADRAQFLGGWRLLSEIGGSGAPLLISLLVGALSLGAVCVVLGIGAFVGGAWLAKWLPQYDPHRTRHSGAL